MNFKKIFAGVVAGSVVASMSMTAFADVLVYPTDDGNTSGFTIDENYTDVNMATVLEETVTGTEVSSITYTVKVADDVNFNPWTFIQFVVTVDGVSTEYQVAGTDDTYSDNGATYTDQVLTLDSAIPAGSTVKIEAYTQSWYGSCADYVFDITVDAAQLAGDASPVLYLAAIVAVAGVALVASKKVHA